MSEREDPVTADARHGAEADRIDADLIGGCGRQCCSEVPARHERRGGRPHVPGGTRPDTDGDDVHAAVREPPRQVEACAHLGSLPRRSAARTARSRIAEDHRNRQRPEVGGLHRCRCSLPERLAESLRESRLTQVEIVDLLHLLDGCDAAEPGGASGEAPRDRTDELVVDEHGRAAHAGPDAPGVLDELMPRQVRHADQDDVEPGPDAVLEDPDDLCCERLGVDATRHGPADAGLTDVAVDLADGHDLRAWVRRRGILCGGRRCDRDDRRDGEQKRDNGPATGHAAPPGIPRQDQRCARCVPCRSTSGRDARGLRPGPPRRYGSSRRPPRLPRRRARVRRVG